MQPSILVYHNYLDAAKRDTLMNSNTRDTSFRAHIALCGLPGAGAWLTVPPADMERETEGPIHSYRQLLPTLYASVVEGCS